MIKFALGFDDAFIGTSCMQHSREPCAVYDLDKCIQILVERDGMTPDEAYEYIDYNTLNSWVGETTPIFMQLSNIKEHMNEKGDAYAER